MDPITIEFHVDEQNVLMTYRVAAQYLAKKRRALLAVSTVLLVLFSVAAATLMEPTHPLKFALPVSVLVAPALAFVVVRWLQPRFRARKFIRTSPNVLGFHRVTISPGTLLHEGPGWENRLKLSAIEDTFVNSKAVSLIYNNAVLTIPVSALSHVGVSQFLSAINHFSNAEEGFASQKQTLLTHDQPYHTTARVTVAHQIKRNQHLYQSRLLAIRVRRIVVRLLFAAVMAINFGAALFSSNGEIQYAAFWVASAILVYLFPLFWHRVGIPLYVRWRAYRQPIRTGVGEITVSLGPDGGWFRSDLGESTFYWEQVDEIYQIPAGLIIQFGQRRSLLIPTEAWDDADQVERDTQEWKESAAPQAPVTRSKSKGVATTSENVFEPPA